MLPSPPSPCVSRCRLDPDLGWCLGCRRTAAEIAAWPTADAPTRRRIAARAARRPAFFAESGES